ncbi:methyl-CpG-binding domain protein 6 [Tachyglossus aculeatus]|uniref:methyl-CpG-binding domain protein 6 n=1 Tax=Tachyglossus aculeatus TaxID=9261 RepID=UPI0018F7B270|nr:methyl-CpG-binding domain protein 6 [Tachyglossus aculeatus]XP_038608706.1 methyl-CpG-binding domain protein 6 [Tachyglossus aculeatus]
MNGDAPGGADTAEGPGPVPEGWQRHLRRGAVHYVSPSGVELVSLEQTRTYLLSDDTCKCGLSCPVRLPQVFNFDPLAPMTPATPDGTGVVEEDMTKLCNHRRKAVAAATPPAPRALLADGESSSVHAAGTRGRPPASNVSGRLPRQLPLGLAVTRCGNALRSPGPPPPPGSRAPDRCPLSQPSGGLAASSPARGLPPAASPRPTSSTLQGRRLRAPTAPSPAPSAVPPLASPPLPPVLSLLRPLPRPPLRPPTESLRGAGATGAAGAAGLRPGRPRTPPASAGVPGSSCGTGTAGCRVEPRRGRDPSAAGSPYPPAAASLLPPAGGGVFSCSPEQGLALGGGSPELLGALALPGPLGPPSDSGFLPWGSQPPEPLLGVPPDLGEPPGAPLLPSPSSGLLAALVPLLGLEPCPRTPHQPGLLSPPQSGPPTSHVTTAPSAPGPPTSGRPPPFQPLPTPVLSTGLFGELPLLTGPPGPLACLLHSLQVPLEKAGLGQGPPCDLGIGHGRGTGSPQPLRGRGRGRRGRRPGETGPGRWAVRLGEGGSAGQLEWACPWRRNGELGSRCSRRRGRGRHGARGAPAKVPLPDDQLKVPPRGRGRGRSRQRGSNRLRPRRRSRAVAGPPP